MTKGRKPVPTALHILRGNPSKKDLSATNEPVLKGAAPTAPRYLSKEAKKHLRQIAKQLVECKVMTKLDGDALSTYCVAWARWVEANDHLKIESTIIKAPGGYMMQNPWLSISNQAFNQMKALLVEFGMTPSSRTKVQAIPDGSGGETDPWGKI